MAFREGINEELFEAALDFIDKHPRSFNMCLVEIQRVECGTVCCVAGVINMLTGIDNGLYTPDRAMTIAAESLGLNLGEQNVLFFESRWPGPFWDEICWSPICTSEYKDVAIRRFRHFLATGE